MINCVISRENHKKNEYERTDVTSMFFEKQPYMVEISFKKFTEHFRIVEQEAVVKAWFGLLTSVNAP